MKAAILLASSPDGEGADGTGLDALGGKRLHPTVAGAFSRVARWTGTYRPGHPLRKMPPVPGPYSLLLKTPGQPGTGRLHNPAPRVQAPPQPGTRPFRHVLPDGRNDPHPLGQRLPHMVAEHRYPLSPRTYGVADADISRSMAPVHAGGGDAKRGSILMSCVTFIKVISHAGSSSGVMCFSVALTQLSNYFIYDII